MVVVFAYSHDRAAAAIVERWRRAGEDAAVLTCADLSRRGWVHRPGDPAASRCVLDGRVVPTSELRAVIVRAPVISDGELTHVHAQDRAYAAAEMQAFMLAWLSSLTCAVINRPSIYNLGGPAWHSAEWIRRARNLGIAVRPLALRSTASASPQQLPRVDAKSPYVDVVGPRAFRVGGRAAAADDPLAATALRLARDVGIEMMRVYFEDAEEPTFVEAGMWIDLWSDNVADALTERCFGFVHARPSETRANEQVARA